MEFAGRAVRMKGQEAEQGTDKVSSCVRDRQKQQGTRLMFISNRGQQRTKVKKPHDPTCFDFWLLRKILSGNCD